jgi:hypothetical protein
VWVLNVRTTSSERWSNHADDRAVDIDPGGNPHVTSSKERRLISLMSGTDFDAGNQGYDAMKATSDAVTAAYNPAGLRERIVQLSATETQKRAASEATELESKGLRMSGSASFLPGAVCRQGTPGRHQETEC